MNNNNALSFDSNVNNEVKIITGGIKFKFTDDSDSNSKINAPLPTGPIVDIVTDATPKTRRKKSPSEKAGTQQVITETLESYTETNNMLKQTIAQVDILSSEVKKDLDSIRNAKTLKGKYQYSSLLTGNLSQLLSTKVAAIREINSSIRISNDLDYKKLKDIKATENQDDDKYIMDLYNAFITNPQSQGTSGINSQSVLGPNTSQMTFNGSGIIRADENVSNDGYTNFRNNMSPEQNMIRYENDPNVKEVLLYDQATGSKHFAVMNMVTKEVIQNVPSYDDEVFLPGTTLDLRNKIARNLDINKSFPLVVINEDKRFDEY